MSKRCLGCMKIKENSPVCEHCGYNENVPNYSHQLPVGTVLRGQYLVGKVLGQGGFGITYMGWDLSLEAPVAIKEYYPNSYVNRDCNQSLDVVCAGEGMEDLFRYNRERFLREARILAKLSSVPGIVRVSSLFSEHNTAYIIMEYVEGIDLKRYIRIQNRVLTVAEAFAVLRPIMDALEKVHAAELVHRDISPDNIMIQPDGSAKLLDFGAAREVEHAEVDKELPQSTEAILKHGFAPMEQYRRRGSLGPWTDVYALCATLYYCLTGKVPNSAPERILGDDNVNWKQIPGLTNRQIAALEKGMELVPENRTRSIAELRRGLFTQTRQPAVSKAPVSKAKPVDYPTNTVPLEEKPSVPVVMETKKKKRKPLGLMAAVLAVAAVAVGVFALKPKNSESPIPLPEVFPAATETTEAVVFSEEEIRYREAEAWEADGQLGKAAIAFGKLGDYADAWERSSNLWAQIMQRQTVVLTRYYGSYWSNKGTNDVAFGVKQDGTMRTAETSNPGHLPPFDLSDWSDIVCIDGDGYAVVGLRSDGRVLCACRSEEYMIDTSTWTDVVAIDYYGTYVIGQKADGTIVTTGDSNRFDLSKVSEWTDIIKVYLSEISGYILGLKADGTVVLEENANSGLDFDVSDWTDIIEIKVGRNYVVGLKSDGTLVATGDNEYGQCDVSAWTDIVAFETSYGDGEIGSFTVGLKSDGTVVAAGCNRASWHLDSLAQWSDIQEISVGATHILGLKSDGTVVGGGREYWDCLDVSDWTNIVQVITTQYNTRALKADGTVLTIGNTVMGQCGTSEWNDIIEPIRMDYCFRSDGTVLTADNRYTDLIQGWTDMKLPVSNPALETKAPETQPVLAENVLSRDWKEIITKDPIYRPFESLSQIESITFLNTLEDAPEQTWDVSENADSSVLAWVVYSKWNGKPWFNLYIAAEGGVNAPADSSELFADTNAVMWDLTINFNGAFHTENVTNMSRMFYNCCAQSLDLSCFDTSNVTDMSYMFCFLNYLSSPLDLSNFDTSKVTNMRKMFWYYPDAVNLELGEFDTSNVTSYEMFMEDGATINGQPWEELFAR